MLEEAPVVLTCLVVFRFTGFLDSPPRMFNLVCRLQKLTQLWCLNQEATEKLVCGCMNVAWSFTSIAIKPNQIDEHICKFEQYRAAKKVPQSKPGDSDTTDSTTPSNFEQVADKCKVVAKENGFSETQIQAFVDIARLV